MKGIADDPGTPAKPADSANTVTPKPGDDIKPPTA
jgi:hypothetical protein